MKTNHLFRGTALVAALVTAWAVTAPAHSQVLHGGLAGGLGGALGGHFGVAPGVEPGMLNPSLGNTLGGHAAGALSDHATTSTVGDRGAAVKKAAVKDTKATAADTKSTARDTKSAASDTKSAAKKETPDPNAAASASLGASTGVAASN
ncbi:MAG TPA: hypothetical protein VJQ47_02945 [Steroidobacteraceae bacterium]|nr:hypothetical protein [Steroidobacteraceae bacterium]